MTHSIRELLKQQKTSSDYTPSEQIPDTFLKRAELILELKSKRFLVQGAVYRLTSSLMFLVLDDGLGSESFSGSDFTGLLVTERYALADDQDLIFRLDELDKPVAALRDCRMKVHISRLTDYCGQLTVNDPGFFQFYLNNPAESHYRSVIALLRENALPESIQVYSPFPLPEVSKYNRELLGVEAAYFIKKHNEKNEVFYYHEHSHEIPADFLKQWCSSAYKPSAVYQLVAATRTLDLLGLTTLFHDDQFMTLGLKTENDTAYLAVIFPENQNRKFIQKLTISDSSGNILFKQNDKIPCHNHCVFTIIETENESLGFDFLQVSFFIDGKTYFENRFFADKE